MKTVKEQSYSLRNNDIFVINSLQKCSLILNMESMALSLRISAEFLTNFCPEVDAPWIECKSFLLSEKEQ